MHRLTVEEVEEIAFVLARKALTFNEPIPDFSTRFPHILESCVGSPFQTYGGKDLYPTLAAKASILFYLMNKNHPFKNGNKRIAMTSLLVVLHLSGKWLKVDTQTFYIAAVWVAQSPPDAKSQVLEYIEKFIKTHLIQLEEKDGS